MDIPDNTSFNAGVLIILCGLVGSGKSTFATALQREFPEFRRCNQDELGRREDVEREVTVALSQGLSVCVDRTNFDPSQRRTWIDIARQYSGVEIWGIKMDTPYNTCHARLIERKEHPTLKTPEKAVEVLSRFSSQFVPINVNEGFNRVYSIAPQESPDYTLEELEIILTAIREILEGAVAADEALSLIRGIAVMVHPTLTVGAPIMHHHGVRILETLPHNGMVIIGALKPRYPRMCIETTVIPTGVRGDIVDEEVPTTTRVPDKVTETTELIPEAQYQGVGINPPLDLSLLCSTPTHNPLHLKILMYLVLFDII
ncbi:hypothetical protein OPQ81_007534 [Rhizoctonia solani]|nr:hypothetical protein OPQ81_007534 [Rhizoctonia solani]